MLTSRDFLQVLISLQNNRVVPIWNLYNTPIGADPSDDVLNKLLCCRDRPDFIAGNFNLQHPLWDSKNITAKPTHQELIDWYNTQKFYLLNPTETPSPNRGGNIDLSFCTDSHANCEARTHLHKTSDHEKLVTIIHKGSQKVSSGKIRYKGIDMEVFIQLVGRLGSPSVIWLADEVVTEALKLFELIKTALAVACPWLEAQNRGTQ